MMANISVGGIEELLLFGVFFLPPKSEEDWSENYSPW
jgi:hypothetical protein